MNIGKLVFLAALYATTGCSVALPISAVPTSGTAATVNASTSGSVAAGPMKPVATSPANPMAPGGGMAATLTCTNNFNALDTNHDGFITLAEYTANDAGKEFYIVEGGTAAPPPEPGMMHPTAIALNADGTVASSPANPPSGGVMVPTAATGPVPVAVANPVPPTFQAPENAFKQLDKNGDGKLTMMEFCGEGGPSGTPADHGDTSTAALPDRDPAITGQLTQVVQASGKAQASVLVEEQPGSKDAGQKIMGTFSADTVVLDARGGGLKRADASALKTGQKVKLWLPADGVCAESYPEQCGADVIAIVADS